MWRYMATLLLAILLVGLAACRSPEAGEATAVDPAPDVSSHGSEEMIDYVALVDSLRAAGLAVEPGEPVQQPFFAVDGQTVAANGQQIQIFEFDDTAAAEAAAATVSADGYGVGQTQIEWVDDPHFYRQDRLIVLYVGQDQAVLEALSSTLGPQFAGQ